MPGGLMYGWNPDTEEWVKLKVDADGSIHVVGYVDNLEDIGDVILTAIANNDILYWNAATPAWENKAMWTAAHKDTHDPEDGSDKLDTAIAVKVGEANAIGTSHSLARADHVHEKHHAKYTDAEAKTYIEANVKLDDLQAPEDNTDLDAAAAQHGLMPKNDKIKIDTVAANADVTGSNAPQAHKDSHDGVDGSDKLDTAAPVKVGAANAIGSSHSFSRADHVHEREHARYTDAEAVDAIEADDNLPLASITFIIDGGGSEITDGQKGHLRIPFACTINEVTMLADQTGAIVVDIWKSLYVGFPPDDGDSITHETPPTITATNQKSTDSTLTGWTTAIVAGAILAFNVDSCTDIQRVTISLKVTKT